MLPPFLFPYCGLPRAYRQAKRPAAAFRKRALDVSFTRCAVGCLRWGVQIGREVNSAAEIVPSSIFPLGLSTASRNTLTSAALA